LPSLADKPAGTEVELVLRGSFAQPVFQGSARVVYDSSVVAPVKAERGALLPAGEIVLARADAAPGSIPLSDTDRPASFDGVVPFAFTGRPGGASITPGGGELLRVRFRLKVAHPQGIPIRLQNDPQYLQLRNSKGQRLDFDLEREAGAR